MSYRIVGTRRRQVQPDAGASTAPGAYNFRQRRAAMATHPDLPTPVTPNLPVEPDEGPGTPSDEPTDPEPPPSVS
ncbi:hypothetical protein [Variovorax sp. KBW07]|uniref:hypothetical protein n=1 Tax=Variovorax sp. KBW07 TaxID=2153358 RepID=UPI0021AA0846|nr:hypothetical protein [Variovorax sp. KBW07]